jgi:hypothetical protein
VPFPDEKKAYVGLRTLQSFLLMVTPYRAVGLCHRIDNFDRPLPPVKRCPLYPRKQTCAVH